MSPHVTTINDGVEVDLITARGSWSIRLTEQAGGDLAVIVLNHATGRPALAELIRRDAP